MQYLGALAAQFLHTRSDHRKIVGGAGSGALAAQLLHTCSDYGKIVSGAGSGHVSSLYHCELSRRPLTIPSGASAFDDAGEILMTDLRLGAPARGSQGSRSSGCVEQRMPPPSSEGLSKGTATANTPCFSISLMSRLCSAPMITTLGKRLPETHPFQSRHHLLETVIPAPIGRPPRKGVAGAVADQDLP